MSSLCFLKICFLLYFALFELQIIPANADPSPSPNPSPSLTNGTNETLLGGKLEFVATLKQVKRVYRSYLRKLDRAKTLVQAKATASQSVVTIQPRHTKQETINKPSNLILNSNSTNPPSNKTLLIPSKRSNEVDFSKVNPEKMGVKSTDVANDKACKILLPCRTKGGKHETENLDNCLHWANDEGRAADIMKRICYNNDPDPHFLDESFVKPAPMTHKTPVNLNEGAQSIGFQIPERNIFRHSQFFDIDGMGKLYKDDKGVAGYEFLDWPGETLIAYKNRMTEAQTLLHENLGGLRPCLQLLEFQGKSSKYLDYICNNDEGLEIAAVGLVTSISATGVPDETKQSCLRHKVTMNKNESFDYVYNLRCNLAKNRDKPGSKCATWPIPPGKLYLASGRETLLENYIQPMFVNEDILRRLAHQPEADDVELPLFNQQRLHCNEMNSSDIRTVLDFAFASNRLILGMKCGVIIVKNINQKERSLTFDVAYLRSIDRANGQPDAAPFHKFPYMINTVAATPCCQTNKVCRHLVPLVAVYSSYAAYHTYPDHKTAYLRDMKVIFVSLDNGDTFDQKVLSPTDTIMNLMYWMYTKIPKWQIKDAQALDWIKNEVLFGKNPAFGSEFESTVLVDPIAKYVLQGEHVEEEEEEDPDEEDCYEIVSMASVSEENLLLVLCKYMKKYNDTKGASGPGQASSTQGQEDHSYTYAIFTIPIRGHIPIIVSGRKSKRKFTCKPMPNLKGYQNSAKFIEPTLVRIPKSYSIFILGCEKVIYYSSNGGRTLFLTAFYYNDLSLGSKATYFRSYENKYLTSYPMVAIDPQGKHVVFTFGKHFAYGVISTNQEIHMISGPILENLPEVSGKGGGAQMEPIFIPYFDDSSDMRVGVIYISLLKNSGAEFFAKIYKEHHSIRLLDTQVSIHSNALPFYSESPDTVAGMAKYTIKPCMTFAFKINTSSITMDIGESQTVRVSVKNNQKDLPLNVLLTHDKAANINISVPKGTVGQESSSGILVHEWDIKLTSKPYIIKRDTAKIDAFFASSYSNMEEVTSHLIISTEPQLRCHVQPRGHVSVRFGCSKYMAIHEDERRPHCENFRENFEYEIPEGHYDKDMANYWISERPKFYKIEKNTLKISYDYEMFGCPVEPYRLEDYIPDLRILPIGGNPNTTEGEIFKGEFILIEIFGASGYSFSKKVREANCRTEPQTFEQMLQEWKVRVEAIKTAWYDYSNFDFDAVFQPINIWNRVNYKDCRGNKFIDVEDTDGSEDEEEGDDDDEEDEGEANDFGEEVLDSPYEILTHNEPEASKNKLVWDAHIRQQVYIFLAVAVDPYDSFCTYHTFFGVSITVPKEDPDWILICIYFSTILFLLILILIGYYCKRHHVFKKLYNEAMFNRLLTAAWNLSFRYENSLTNMTKKATKPTK